MSSTRQCSPAASTARSDESGVLLFDTVLGTFGGAQTIKTELRAAKLARRRQSLLRRWRPDLSLWHRRRRIDAHSSRLSTSALIPPPTIPIPPTPSIRRPTQATSTLRSAGPISMRSTRSRRTSKSRRRRSARASTATPSPRTGSSRGSALHGRRSKATGCAPASCESRRHSARRRCRRSACSACSPTRCRSRSTAIPTPSSRAGMPSGAAISSPRSTTSTRI